MLEENKKSLRLSRRSYLYHMIHWNEFIYFQKGVKLNNRSTYIKYFQENLRSTAETYQLANSVENDLLEASDMRALLSVRGNFEALTNQGFRSSQIEKAPEILIFEQAQIEEVIFALQFP